MTRENSHLSDDKADACKTAPPNGGVSPASLATTAPGVPPNPAANTGPTVTPNIGPNAAPNSMPGPAPNTAPNAVANELPPDPFDPERLRLSQDFAVDLGVKKVLVTVPVDKPKNEWWVRVHPGGDYRIETLVLNLKEDREKYLIAPELRHELATEPTVRPEAIFTAINRQGTTFLWPLRLPGPDGKIDQWSQSAMEAAGMAMSGWVRVASDMNLGAYVVWETTAPLPEPKWPAVPFKELLRVAFKGKYIDSLDHPVLKRLRGES
jgi:hypothetical protein